MKPGSKVARVLLAVVAGAVVGASANLTYQATRHAGHPATVSKATTQVSTAIDAAPSSSSSSPAPMDAAAVARKVDAAVVDITTTLANQGGQAAGTGMVITSSGKVLTNNHVIEGATSIRSKSRARAHLYRQGSRHRQSR